MQLLLVSFFSIGYPRAYRIVKHAFSAVLPLLVALLMLVSWTQGLAQTSFTIKRVRFQGLEKTAPSYLKRFIKTETGARLDSGQLKQDAQYLSNVPFILNATYTVQALNEENRTATVTFRCEEQHTLVPIVNFGGLPDNLWFRAGASEANLLGKGIKLSGFYQYYDRNSFQLSVGHPFLGGSQWGANIRLTKWSTQETLFFEGQDAQSQEVTYNYDNYNVELTTNYKFSTGSRPFSDQITIGGVLFK